MILHFLSSKIFTETPCFQDYEVVHGSKKDDTWEKELDSMLTTEAAT